MRVRLYAQPQHRWRLLLTCCRARTASARQRMRQGSVCACMLGAPARRCACGACAASQHPPRHCVAHEQQRKWTAVPSAHRQVASLASSSTSTSSAAGSAAGALMQAPPHGTALLCCCCCCGAGEAVLMLLLLPGCCRALAQGPGARASNDSRDWHLQLARLIGPRLVANTATTIATQAYRGSSQPLIPAQLLQEGAARAPRQPGPAASQLLTITPRS
jgi:hypothetical protein